jgi:hypothetical protein
MAGREGLAGRRRNIGAGRSSRHIGAARACGAPVLRRPTEDRPWPTLCGSCHHAVAAATTQHAGRAGAQRLSAVPEARQRAGWFARRRWSF